MRSIAMMGCVITFTLAGASGPALACGDANLCSNQSADWSASASAHASVLVFADPSGEGGALLGDPDLPKALESAGYDQRVVTSVDAVKQALAERPFDVLLASVSDAPALQSLLGESKSGTVLLPVVGKGGKKDAEAARAAYGDVVTSPVRARSLFASIDGAARR